MLIFCSLLNFVFHIQYSDLAEDERAFILEKFRQVTTRWNKINHTGAGNEDEAGKDDDRSHVIIVTDTCLPLLASGEPPMYGHLLINYELPAKKVGFFFLSIVDIYHDCLHSCVLYLLPECKSPL